MRLRILRWWRMASRKPMASDLVFPLLDEGTLQEEIGAWKAVHGDLSHWFGNVASKLHSAEQTWKGPARTRFLTWWWGVGKGGKPDSPSAGQGAKGDFETLLRMVEIVIGAIEGFSGSVGDVNGPLSQANSIIADHTQNGRFTRYTVSGHRPCHFLVSQGVMYDLGVVAGKKIYIEVEGLAPVLPGGVDDLPYPFPYVEGYHGSDVKPVDWYDQANACAHQAAEAFKDACQDCITALQGAAGLSGQIGWLAPYQNAYGGQAGGGPSDPVTGADAFGPYAYDNVWRHLAGPKHETKRPWPFSNVLGSVTGKPGDPTLHGGGDPFQPSNVPKWYPAPSLGSKILGIFEKYGIPALSLLLVAAGVPEVPAIVDGLFDSEGFLQALTEIAQSGSIDGLIVNTVNLGFKGYDIAIDADKVDSVATAIAKALSPDGEAGPALPRAVFDKLVTQIRDRIVEDAKPGEGSDGKRYLFLDTSTVFTTTPAEDTLFQNAGFDSIVAPIRSHPDDFGGSHGVTPSNA